MSTIVVGVDGSPGAREALRFALAEARLRGAGVTAVYVWSMPLAVSAPGGLVPNVATDLQQGAVEELDAMLDAMLAEQGDVAGVPVEKVAVEGPPARRLIEAAQGADLLVVGSRGRGGFKGLLLGSVSQQCAQHAPCPVVIVRPTKT